MAKYNFKKTLAGIFAVAIVSSSFSLAPYVPFMGNTTITASALEKDGFEYVTVDTGSGDVCNITRYNGTETNVVVPEKIDGVVVAAIGNGAFSNNETAESIELPDTVTSIGKSAFFGCSSLKSISIPDGVKSIDNKAFYLCMSLESVTLPDTVTSIGESVFYNCRSLTSINIPDNVTEIGQLAFFGCESMESIALPKELISIGTGAFSGCTELTDVTIGDSVTSIGTYAFDGCKKLKSITIPDSVTSIGESAFSNCRNLTSVTIPNTVTSIGESVFYNCRSLTSINIPDNVTEIGQFAFFGCASMESIALPKKLISIGTGAFSSCTALTDVTIGDSVTSIGTYAFDSCQKLKSITIPDSVTSMGSDVFIDCSAMDSITAPCPLKATESGWKSSNCFADVTYTHNIPDGANECACKEECIYVFDKETGTISDYFGTDTEVVVPAEIDGVAVKIIGDFAFSCKADITSIELPNSVTSIGTCAFDGCIKLESITIPDSVTSMGSDVFIGCSAMDSITAPCPLKATESGWKSSNCFADVTYTHNIPDGANECACKEECIYVFDKETGTISDYFGTDTEVVVPAEIDGVAVKIIGDFAFSCKADITSIELPNSVTSIGEAAFSTCSNLTSVTIPNTVTSIGESAFSSCQKMTGITIPDSVTSIGNYAFYASGIESVSIPKSVTSIGDAAFSTCKNLPAIDVDPENTAYCSVDGVLFSKDKKTLLVYPLGKEGTEYTVPDTVTSIQEAAFVFCESLTDVKLPDSLETIGMAAFGACSNLKSIEIPASVTSISSQAFYRCTSLTDVRISDSVETIGEAIFGECSSLESVVIPKSVSSIGAAAFIDCNALKTVYYRGDQADWENITIGDGNESLTNAEKVYNTIKVSFDTGDTGIDIDDVYIGKANTVSEPTGLTTPDGYIFGGWFKNSKYSFPFDFSTMLSFDTVLYGKWQATSGTIGENVDWKYDKDTKELTISGNGTKTDEFGYKDPEFYGFDIESVKFETTNLEVIDEFLFYNLFNLTEITLPDTIKQIGYYTFGNCMKLESVELPETVTSIGAYAFGNCTNLTDISIPASVTSIDDAAFRDCGLESVTFECADKNAIENFDYTGSDILFLNCPKLEAIYVPAGCAEAYKSSVGYQAAFGDYINKIVEIPAVKGYSASYNGDVTINFHYAVPSNYTNGYIKFGDGTMVAVNDAATDGNGYYMFPISMPAKNMYDEITAQFYDENDNALGGEVTFKMSDYLSAVKEAAPNAACAEFVDSFLEYGAQAANYFNVSGAPTAKTYTDADYDAVITALAAYENVKIDDDTFVGATLLLKSIPKLRLYYSEPFTGAEQNELNPDLFYTEKEIAPTKFGTEDLNDYYVYNYIYKAMNSDDESLKAICIALYNMSKAIPAEG